MNHDPDSCERKVVAIRHIQEESLDECSESGNSSPKTCKPLTPFSLQSKVPDFDAVQGKFNTAILPCDILSNAYPALSIPDTSPVSELQSRLCRILVELIILRFFFFSFLLRSLVVQKTLSH